MTQLVGQLHHHRHSGKLSPESSLTHESGPRRSPHSLAMPGHLAPRLLIDQEGAFRRDSDA